MGIIVDDYSFGRIRVTGKEYTSDVIIYSNRVDSSWWRNEGHLLIPEDMSDILLDPPATLVIGTGYFGRMEVPAETLEKIRERGIGVFVARTKEAVGEFNRLQQQHGSAVAALHLTC